MLCFDWLGFYNVANKIKKDKDILNKTYIKLPSEIVGSFNSDSSKRLFLLCKLLHCSLIESYTLLIS